MTELQFDAPIKWPAHILQTERLKRTQNPQFKMGMSEQEAIGFLQDEINMTPTITSAKLSCNAMNMTSPMPTQYLSKMPGAALTVRIENQPYTLCCDKWQTLSHNIYALHLAIRQFRQLVDYGIGTLPILLSGFSQAATASANAGASGNTTSQNNASHWQNILGLSSTATLDDANAIYRARAKTLAEDPGKLQELNLAIAEARKHFGA